MALWGQPKKEDAVTELTPAQVNENVNTVKVDLEKKLTDLGDSINNHPTLLAMKEFLDGQRNDEAEAQRQADAAAAAARNKGFENLDAGTRSYVDTQLQPVAKAALWQQGTEVRRTIFEDQEAFPMYTGALKAKIDEYIDKQSPEARANPEVVRNVYKIVCHDHQAEITEGKHKSRLSSAVNPGTGTGASGTGGDPTKLPVLTEMQKRVARGMGMDEKDYATAMKDLQESGEYV